MIRYKGNNRYPTILKMYLDAFTCCANRMFEISQEITMSILRAPESSTFLKKGLEWLFNNLNVGTINHLA